MPIGRFRALWQASFWLGCFHSLLRATGWKVCILSVYPPQSVQGSPLFLLIDNYSQIIRVR